MIDIDTVAINMHKKNESHYDQMTEKERKKKNLLTVLHKKILLLHPSQLTPSVKGSTMKLINSNTITLTMPHVCMG